MSLDQPRLSPEEAGKSAKGANADTHHSESSSEDEFSDAREAIASPTRPITRVERVDTLPAHGEIPGSDAYDKRAEDARPDEIAIPGAFENPDQTDSSDPTPINQTHSVPTTVVTRVDSMPAHGEVPGTEAAELRAMDAKPDFVERKKDTYSNGLEEHSNRLNTSSLPPRSKSPIAADGGFGPMDFENDAPSEESNVNEQQEQLVDEADFGDDFDDFAEGEEADDDFGDFDDGLKTEDQGPLESPKEQASVAPLPYPVLDFLDEVPDLNRLESMLSPHMRAIFPSAEPARETEPPPSLPQGHGALFTERSHSLWQQLISPPPLQPPNWSVKSGSKPKDGKAAASTKEQPPRRSRGPPPPPEFDTDEVERLCKKTAADLDEMTDAELKGFAKKVEELAEVGKSVLHYWIKRKESAVDEKEAFDSVVENLVRHARRVR